MAPLQIISLIFVGRCSLYFWDISLKIKGYLIFVRSFSSYWFRNNFSKKNCFRVYRKLLTWPTVDKKPRGLRNADNGQKSKRFSSNTVLCRGFKWQMVKTRMIRLRGVKGQNAWSNCVLCIPFILSGSPKECWLNTCDACVITTWRLGFWAPLVACKYNYLILRFANFGRVTAQPQQCLKSITAGPSTVLPSMKDRPPHATLDCEVLYNFVLFTKSVWVP